MLVEKKSWKNLIKPVFKYLGIYLLIFFIFFIFVKFAPLPLSDDFGIKHIAVMVVSALLAWLVFVLELCNLKKDFHQIVKVDDLSTLTNDEYQLFLKRFPYEISQQESDFIQNHILSETEIIFIINETQELLTEAFILIRLLSTHGTTQEDFKIISSIADYLHNIPVSLKTIMAEKKLNFCYIEFIKRLNACCSEVLKTDFPDIYTLEVNLYISSFTEMKKTTDNIIFKTIHPEEIKK